MGWDEALQPVAQVDNEDGYTFPRSRSFASALCCFARRLMFGGGGGGATAVD